MWSKLKVSLLPLLILKQEETAGRVYNFTCCSTHSTQLHKHRHCGAAAEPVTTSLVYIFSSITSFCKRSCHVWWQQGDLPPVTLNARLQSDETPQATCLHVWCERRHTDNNTAVRLHRPLLLNYSKRWSERDPISVVRGPTGGLLRDGTQHGDN